MGRSLDHFTNLTVSTITCKKGWLGHAVIHRFTRPQDPFPGASVGTVVFRLHLGSSDSEHAKGASRLHH